MNTSNCATTRERQARIAWIYLMAIVVATMLVSEQYRSVDAIGASTGADQPELLWSWLHPSPQGQSLVDVSCAGGTCVAIPSAGPPPFVTSRDEGQTWVAGVLADRDPWYAEMPAYWSVECPSPTACIALGDVIASSFDGGLSWSTYARPEGWLLADVRCPAPDLCYAVGGNVVMTTEDMGASWAVVTEFNFSPEERYLRSIDCPDVLTCFAISYSLEYFTFDEIYRTEDGGESWLIVRQDTIGARTLTCSDADHCVLSTPSLSVTADGGATWQESGYDGRAVDCSRDAAFCLAITREDQVITSIDHGLTWNSVGPVPDWLSSSAGLTCPTASRCSAAGADGSLATTLDGGQTWLNGKNSVTDVGLNSAACVAGRCVAVGRSGIVIVSEDNGQTWELRPFPSTAELRVVVCPTPSSCLIVDGEGNLFASDDGGQSWAQRLVLPAGEFTDLVCPTTAVCGALGVAEDPYFGPVNVVVRTDDGGQTWDVSFLEASDLQYLSCPSATDCYAFGRSGEAASTHDGLVWEALPPIPATSPILIGCPDASSCFVIASTGGSVLRTLDGGNTWETGGFSDPDLKPAAKGTCLAQSFCVIPAWKRHDGPAEHFDPVLATTIDFGLSLVPSPRYPGDHLDCVSSNRCLLMGDQGAVIEVILSYDLGHNAYLPACLQ